MRTKTRVRAGGQRVNHNQSGVRVKTRVRAGGRGLNHNQSRTAR